MSSPMQYYRDGPPNSAGAPGGGAARTYGGQNSAAIARLRAMKRSHPESFGHVYEDELAQEEQLVQFLENQAKYIRELRKDIKEKDIQINELKRSTYDRDKIKDSYESLRHTFGNAEADWREKDERYKHELKEKTTELGRTLESEKKLKLQLDETRESNAANKERADTLAQEVDGVSQALKRSEFNSGRLLARLQETDQELISAIKECEGLRSQVQTAESVAKQLEISRMETDEMRRELARVKSLLHGCEASLLEANNKLRSVSSEKMDIESAVQLWKAKQTEEYQKKEAQLKADVKKWQETAVEYQREFETCFEEVKRLQRDEEAQAARQREYEKRKKDVAQVRPASPVVNRPANFIALPTRPSPFTRSPILHYPAHLLTDPLTRARSR
eukprot:GHVU01200332.1.p1 GENE.GHVU01200332.1~~GHVU01200332.1.p1  ORF type:complete len:390 (-),score=69.01 GHVU01200332.1:2514-3683(-)